jgi:polyisoprenoid-binding protein YceI
MATETWDIDYGHSSIGFSVRHMVVAKVRGHFTKWEGKLSLDTENLAGSSVDVTIDATSIDTRDAQRDGHLKSPDFLDVEKFGTIAFKSTKVEKKADDEITVSGNLTIHGVTKEVVLTTEYGGRAKDPWGGERAGFTAKTKVNRKDFGLAWNQVLEAGGVLVGETIEISIDVEAKKVG